MSHNDKYQYDYYTGNNIDGTYNLSDISDFHYSDNQTLTVSLSDTFAKGNSGSKSSDKYGDKYSDKYDETCDIDGNPNPKGYYDKGGKACYLGKGQYASNCNEPDRGSAKSGKGGDKACYLGKGQYADNCPTSGSGDKGDKYGDKGDKYGDKGDKYGDKGDKYGDKYGDKGDKYCASKGGKYCKDGDSKGDKGDKSCYLGKGQYKPNCPEVCKTTEEQCRTTVSCTGKPDVVTIKNTPECNPNPPVCTTIEEKCKTILRCKGNPDVVYLKTGPECPVTPPNCEATNTCPPPPCEKLGTCPPPNCQTTGTCPPPNCQTTGTCPPPPTTGVSEPLGFLALAFAILAFGLYKKFSSKPQV